MTVPGWLHVDHRRRIWFNKITRQRKREMMFSGKAYRTYGNILIELSELTADEIEAIITDLVRLRDGNYMQRSQLRADHVHDFKPGVSVSRCACGATLRHGPDPEKEA